MKHNPDSYLLYEAGKFITYNIRIKVVMNDSVNGEALEAAAQTAFARFPYYAKEISILKNGEIELIDNKRPLVIAPTKDGHIRLGTEETNYHLCCIDYENNVIYFNMHHGLCGGCGVMFWIKSTLWHYVKEAFGVTLETGNIKTADTPFVEGETAYPDVNALSSDEPLGTVKKDTVYIPAIDYTRQLVTTPFRDTKFYELELDTKDFIKYARSNDGSPNSILSALMFKAVCRVTPKSTKPIRGSVLCNYRADVGCPETYHDLVRLMAILYPRKVENKSIEFLSTMTRSMMYVQMQPEFSTKAFRETQACKDNVDAQNGLLRKRLFALTHSPYTKAPFGTFLVSYVGRDEWYGLENYVERIHSITDGNLMLEVNSLRDKFHLTFMDAGINDKFYKAFCEVMREENISFKEYGCFERKLPYIILPKKNK